MEKSLVLVVEEAYVDLYALKQLCHMNLFV